MSVNIHDLIAAINSDVYCDPSVRKEVKSIVAEHSYLKAAEIAKPFKSDFLFDYDEANKNPLANWGLKSPIEQHKLSYDSTAEGLEPAYFWILDFLSSISDEVNKITDNFISSPGSGHFTELTNKAMQMQQEVSRSLGNVNTVIKSILNILYDLKDFKLRIGPYDDYKSEDLKKKHSALLSLKQVWIDNVDIRKGQGSINALSSGSLDFVTLRDAFLTVKKLEDVDKIDLNERVKRILRQRIEEFFRWISESERSLKQRFEIEKRYLQTQVSSVKLYSRWLKPYLKAAKSLEQRVSPQASLVTTFNTILLELKLLAKSNYKPADDVDLGLLPDIFKNVKARKYYPIVIVEFNFRGIPQRISQRGDWAFGGKTDITLTSYALNDQELKILKEEIEKDDLGDIMQLIDGTTTESLDQMQTDIDEFLKEEDEEKKRIEEEAHKAHDVNPFTALFSFLIPDKTKKTQKTDDLSHGISLDNRYEKTIRSQAIIQARMKCFSIFDTYKKANAMPTYHTSPFEVL